MRNINEGYPSRQSAKLEKKYRIENIRKGKNSIREVAKLTGVSVSTIQRVKAAMYEKTLAPALKDIEHGNICRQRDGESVKELLERIVGEP